MSPHKAVSFLYIMLKKLKISAISKIEEMGLAAFCDLDYAWVWDQTFYTTTSELINSIKFCFYQFLFELAQCVW